MSYVAGVSHDHRGTSCRSHGRAGRRRREAAGQRASGAARTRARVPCVPYGGRRPGRCGGSGRPARALSSRPRLTIAAVVAGAALLAACGGSSGGAASPRPPASAAPTPVPSPLITSGPPPAAAVDVVKQFWTLAGEGRLAEAQRFLVAPGSPILAVDRRRHRRGALRAPRAALGRRLPGRGRHHRVLGRRLDRCRLGAERRGATPASTSCSSTSCACPTARGGCGTAAPGRLRPAAAGRRRRRRRARR